MAKEGNYRDGGKRRAGRKQPEHLSTGRGVPRGFHMASGSSIRLFEGNPIRKIQVEQGAYSICGWISRSAVKTSNAGAAST